MSPSTLFDACDTIFQSPAKTLTVEFQGGDPLLRFDLLCDAIERVEERNKTAKRNVRFVVASTLHQLTEEMCEYFRKHDVLLSTSVDGPPILHNKNRPIPTRDSYERTVRGIELARRVIGLDSVSALMTTTRDSLDMPDEIVDEYVMLGFRDIFLRPLALYGFARRNENSVGYSSQDFAAFYEKAFKRVWYWNQHGVPLREITAALALNKMLCPFDAGFVDLQTPTGAGLAVVVYNYDGYVYPSDEARMLAATGDISLRLGQIGESLASLLSGNVAKGLIRTSLSRFVPGCRDCAFNTYCGPDPVGAQAQFGTMEMPIAWTSHCQLQKWLFEFLFRFVRQADEAQLTLANAWSRP